jgi:hypothetical protein
MPQVARCSSGRPEGIAKVASGIVLGGVAYRLW